MLNATIQEKIILLRVSKFLCLLRVHMKMSLYHKIAPKSINFYGKGRFKNNLVFQYSTKAWELVQPSPFLLHFFVGCILTYCFRKQIKMFNKYFYNHAIFHFKLFLFCLEHTKTKFMASVVKFFVLFQWPMKYVWRQN